MEFPFKCYKCRFIAYAEKCYKIRVPMKICATISLQRKFFGVKMLSETVRSTADVIREAEREGTSDQ